MKKTIEFNPSMGGKLESITMGEDGKIVFEWETALDMMNAMTHFLCKLPYLLTRRELRMIMRRANEVYKDQKRFRKTGI